MKRPHRLLPLALIAATLAAGAAQPLPAGPTYRIVGPDGKVTYSDRQPTDPQLKTRELGKTLTAPLLSSSNEPFDLHPSTAMPSPARPAGDGLTPAVDVGGRPFPTGLPDAILGVVVHQFFVQTLVETCSRQHPAFAERYQGSVRNWRDRNADILSKSNRITFARFTGEQRDMIRASARTRLAQLLPSPGSSDADKASWCDRMNSDLARRQFELVGDMRLAPILVFDLP